MAAERHWQRKISGGGEWGASARYMTSHIRALKAAEIAGIARGLMSIDILVEKARDIRSIAMPKTSGKAAAHPSATPFEPFVTPTNRKGRRIASQVRVFLKVRSIRPVPTNDEFVSVYMVLSGRMDANAANGITIFSQRIPNSIGRAT